jgi:hypothetical protein
VSETIKQLWIAISRHWRELAGFSLLFRIFEGLLFAPFIALVGKWLLGRTVLDSTALVSFLLSPRGLVACVCGATTLLTIRLIEHTGLSAVFFGGFDGRKVSALEAARIVRRHLLVLGPHIYPIRWPWIAHNSTTLARRRWIRDLAAARDMT